MKPNELMIDDWVEYGQYITTVRHLSDKIVLSGCVGRLDEVRPVPITPEILEANGFIKSGYMCRCCHNLADFDNHAQLDYNLKFSTFEIKRMKNRAWSAKIYIDAHYVHELQHALRLADLNDMADNFKIEKGGQQ